MYSSTKWNKPLLVSVTWLCVVNRASSVTACITETIFRLVKYLLSSRQMDYICKLKNCMHHLMVDLMHSVLTSQVRRAGTSAWWLPDCLKIAVPTLLNDCTYCINAVSYPLQSRHHNYLISTCCLLPRTILTHLEEHCSALKNSDT